MPVRRPRVLAALLALTILGACSASSQEPNHAAAAARPGRQPASTVGFDGRTIRVGELTALSGPQRYVGLSVTAGSTAYFDRVNTELGGIAGKYKVAVDVQDTGGDPAKAAKAYGPMQADDAVLGQVLGDATVSALLPHLRADQVLAAPVLAANDLRDANLLPLGVPVDVEAANGLEWYLVHHATTGPVCSVVQQDPWGDQAQAGLAAAAAFHHLSLGPEVRVPGPQHDPGDLDRPLSQLRDAGCAAAFVFTTPATTTAVLTYGSAAELDLQWIAVSGSWTSTLVDASFHDYLTAHLAVVTEGQAWGDGRVPANLDVSSARAGYSPASPPDTWFRFGYLQASMITALLEKAVSLGDLSRAGLLAASRDLGRVSFLGVVPDYTYGPPDARRPPTSSAIAKVDPHQQAGLVIAVRSVRSPVAGRLVAAER